MDDELKLALLSQLSTHIRELGSSHDIVADRLGIARADVSAIHAGDAKRFTFERIRRMLRRVGRDINVDVVAAGEGGRVESDISLQSLGLSHLADVAASTEPGLVLIGGDPNNGQQSLLQALIAEHVLKGANAVAYASMSRRASSPWRPTTAGLRLVRFDSDVDLDQRARFGFDIIGIDAIGQAGADPWTVLHFAKNTRTYAIIESPTGAAEGQYAFDQFVARLGPPRVATHRTLLLEVLREIVVVHAELKDDEARPTYFASRHMPHASDPPITPSDDEATQLTLARTTELRSQVSRRGVITSPAEARAFLHDVHELLGSSYEVEAPSIEAKREIEMHVRHRVRDATVTVAASWHPSAKRYGVVISTDEPDDLMELGDTPETRLSLAPTDAGYVVGVVRRFLARFDRPVQAR